MAFLQEPVRCQALEGLVALLQHVEIASDTPSGKVGFIQ